MPFNSTSFIIFLGFTIAAFNLAPLDKRIYIIVAASLTFYGYLNIYNLIFVILITTIVYVVSISNHRFRTYVAGGISFLIGCLIIARLTPELEEYLGLKTVSSDSYLTLITPIGVSFYTLQAIGYLIDVRDKIVVPEKNVFKVVAFISFFPQSLAGPIHRGKDLLPQFENLTGPNAIELSLAIKQIVFGYFSKLIIADKIALVIDPIFISSRGQDGASLFAASMLYALQIYIDFYAYTQIAIGIARLFGVKFNQNFNQPYMTYSFREFWKRWHISLSSWLRDYVYLRMGGRRQKTYFQFALVLTFTFITSSIWHGLALNFLIWGVLHAALYLLEDRLKAVGVHRLIRKSAIVRVIAHGLFFAIITFTWLIFRTTDIGELRLIIIKVIDVNHWSVHSLAQIYESIYFPFLFLMVSLLTVKGTAIISYFLKSIPNSNIGRIGENSILVGLLLMIFIFGDLGVQQFLYFRF